MTSKQPVEMVIGLRSAKEALEEIRPFIPKGLKVRHAKAFEKDSERGMKRTFECVLCKKVCVYDSEYELQKDQECDIMAFAGTCPGCGALNTTLEVAVFRFPQILGGRLFNFEDFNNFVTGYGFTERAECSLGDFQWKYKRENYSKGDESFWIDRHIIGPALVKRRNFNAVVMEAVRAFKKVHPSIAFLSEYYQFDCDV